MTRDEARAKLVELTGIVPHSLSLAARIEAAIDAFEAAALRVVPPEGGPRPDEPRLSAEANAIRDAFYRPYAGGQPPSDGMPSEPSEEARKAALLAYCEGGMLASLRAAYAAERGVSAVPPTEEPNE